jgi:sortase (surface protein transpeptidase)
VEVIAQHGKMKRHHWKVWLTLVICVAGVVAGLWLALGSTVQEIIDSHQAETTAKTFKKTMHTSNSKGHKLPENVVSVPSVGIYQPVYATPSGLNYGVYGSGNVNNNFIIAGHSSYVSRVWFSSLFNLRTSSGYVVHDGAPYRPSDYKGDKGAGGLVYLYTREAKYTYRADEAYTVKATDVTVTAQGDAGEPRQLHLYTCPYTKDKHPTIRYVVQAQLIKVQATKSGIRDHIQTQLTVK